MTDDDGAAAHVDICKALILAHQTAGERDDAVGNGESQDLHVVDVNAERTAHGGVVAGGTEGGALFGPEVPVEHGHQRDRYDRRSQDGKRDIA